jgi:hypothetical protein
MYVRVFTTTTDSFMREQAGIQVFSSSISFKTMGIFRMTSRWDFWNLLYHVGAFQPGKYGVHSEVIYVNFAIKGVLLCGHALNLAYVLISSEIMYLKS